MRSNKAAVIQTVLEFSHYKSVPFGSHPAGAELIYYFIISKRDLLFLLYLLFVLFVKLSSHRNRCTGQQKGSDSRIFIDGSLKFIYNDSGFIFCGGDCSGGKPVC